MATDEEKQANFEAFVERVLDVEENPQTETLPWDGYQYQPGSPLNTVIQKLDIFGRSLSRDFSIAKERIRNVPADELSPDESAAIYLYTMKSVSMNGSLYECINKALRAKDRTPLSTYYPFFKIFLAALSKLDSKGQLVYRGVKMDLSEKYPVGKTFVWSGFSSCTTSAQMLSHDPFLGASEVRTIFKIHCLNGKNIREHSSLSTIDEIILPANTKFKVILQTSPSMGLHIIDIQEIVPANLLRQRSLSISDEINPFSEIEPHPYLIKTHMANVYNDSKCLIRKIEEQRNRSEADFSSSKVNSEHILLIADEIKINTNWNILKLNDNKIDNPAMTVLSPTLVVNSTINTLYLDRNHIAGYGIRQLADALTQNFTLTNLSLSYNDIKDDGAKAIAELLRHNSTLTHLCLENNIIGDSGMIALCETLEQYNRKLEKLSIDHNIITDHSLDAIMAFRNMNHVLNDFTYNDNKFTKQTEEKLQAIDKKHKETLKSLLAIDDVAIVHLEIKSKPEKRLSRDATFLFTDFRRLLKVESFDQFIKQQSKRTIYLILSCDDEPTIRMISLFCSKKKIFLFILQTTKEKTDKNPNIFPCEESMMFRITTRLATHYRSIAESAVRMGDKEKARNYFQQATDIQEKLVIYLKKRRVNLDTNQNEANGNQKVNQLPETQTTKSLITVVED